MTRTRRTLGLLCTASLLLAASIAQADPQPGACAVPIIPDGQFVSLSSDVTTLGVDIRGSIDEYYAISADGGGTYGNLKALNSSNLLAESMAGKGLDVIRPTGVITTSSPFTISGLFSPRWVDLTIGYQGLWAEDLGGTDLWTEDT